VARFAGIAGLHVIRRLAGRATAVVTAHAIAGDTSVLEAGRAPRGGVVARIAVERRDDMVGWLAYCASVVVAALTTATHFIVLEARCRYERCCRVALAATFGAQHVIGGLRGCADERAAAVASHAFARCAFEYGVDVARFAPGVAMPAGQLETSRAMVERAGRCCAGSCNRASPQQCQQQCERRDSHAGRSKVRQTGCGHGLAL